MAFRPTCAQVRCARAGSRGTAAVWRAGRELSLPDGASHELRTAKRIPALAAELRSACGRASCATTAKRPHCRTRTGLPAGTLCEQASRRVLPSRTFKWTVSQSPRLPASLLGIWSSKPTLRAEKHSGVNKASTDTQDWTESAPASYSSSV